MLLSQYDNDRLSLSTKVIKLDTAEVPGSQDGSVFIIRYVVKPQLHRYTLRHAYIAQCFAIVSYYSRFSVSAITLLRAT